MSGIFSIALLDIVVLAHVIFLLVVTLRIRRLQFDDSGAVVVGEGRLDKKRATFALRQRWISWCLYICILAWIVNFLSHITLIIVAYAGKGLTAESLKILPALLERICVIMLAISLPAILDTDMTHLRSVFCSADTDSDTSIGSTASTAEMNVGTLSTQLSSNPSTTLPHSSATVTIGDDSSNQKQ
jgi:hypothetical protein